jgi:hypothetical protein
LHIILYYRQKAFKSKYKNTIKKEKAAPKNALGYGKKVKRPPQIRKGA